MKKRLWSILLAITIVMTFLPAMSFAESLEILTINPTLESEDLWAGDVGHPVTINNEDSIKGAKIVGATSSDPEVIEIQFDQYDKTLNALRPRPLKPGRSEITLTYSLNGVQNSISADFNVLEYPNYISSLTIDGHSVDCSSFKYYINKIDYKDTKPNIRFVLNPGWSLDYAEYSKQGHDGGRISTLDATLDYPDNGTQLWVLYFFKNDAGKTIKYEIDFFRPEKEESDPVPESDPQEEGAQAAAAEAAANAVFNGTPDANVPAAKGAKVKAAKKSFTVSWKKATKKKLKKFDKVEVQYSQDPSFPRTETSVKEVKKTKKSLKVKKLAKKSVYYVRVRGIKYVGVTKHVSGWSRVKKAKIK